MPKITLTPELSEKLKMERLNCKMTALELATRLNISTGRLSNIENSKIKEIDLDLFNDLIQELIPEDKRKEYIDTLLNDTVVRFSKKDIEKQDWFTIFDLQIRKIPITTELLDWLKNTCEEISFSPKQIIKIVNENNIDESTPEFMRKYKKCKPNQLYFEHKDDKVHQYIKFDLPLNLLDKIISGEISDICYIFMAGIVNAFTQIESCKYYAADAYTILYNLKFYKLKEKRKILAAESTLNPFSSTIPALSKTENEYLSLKGTLLKHLDKFNDLDPSKTNTRLEALNNNFNTDPGFTFAFCTLPLDRLKGLDKETKLNFLKEMKTRIEALANNSKLKEEIDDYDI